MEKKKERDHIEVMEKYVEKQLKAYEANMSLPRGVLTAGQLLAWIEQQENKNKKK